MKDQLVRWNDAHTEQWLHQHSFVKTAFAKEVGNKLPAGSAILELGCGKGNDSIYFAELGHHITATDFSDVAIRQNKKRWTHPNLTFKIQDISQPFALDDASFDVVYARLSLHYFTDEITKKIFREISRVLKPGGMLYFMCKSTADRIYGQGDKIENDMYEFEGYVIHFFSQEYALKLLSESGLNPEHTETGEAKFYGRRSAFIKVTAKKCVI